MLTLEKYNELVPFMDEIKRLISLGDDGSGIAALVNVPTISPLYEPLVGMLKRFNRYILMIGVGRKYQGFFRLFIVLHEVFHIKLDHISIAGFLNANGDHAEFESFRNPFIRKLLVDTEKETNIFAALTLFDDSILERTGYQYLQSIEDTSDSLRKLEKTLDTLRYRWSVTRDPEIRREIRQCEMEKQALEASLERLRYKLEDRGTFETIDEIAVDYLVPPACIQCYLEGKRMLGYNVIPTQKIDWFHMFDPEDLTPYQKNESYDAC